MNFPNWVQVQYFDIDQFYDLDQHPEVGVNYQEMDDVRHGDINKLAAYTDQSEQEFGPNNEDLNKLRTSGIEIYLTFNESMLAPPKTKPIPDHSGLDDSDEFEANDGMPNIGLVFNEGVYIGHGLGGGKFANIIQKHFDPYRRKPGDYDAILDTALKEVYDKFSVEKVAREMDDFDLEGEHNYETWP